MKRSLFHTPSFYVSAVLAGALAFQLYGIVAAQTWTGPFASPPAGNPEQPIDTSALRQVKKGDFAVSEDGAFTDTGGVNAGVALYSHWGTIYMRQGGSLSGLLSLTTNGLRITSNNGAGAVDLGGNKAVVFPRTSLSTAYAAEGAVVYDTDSRTLKLYNGTGWNSVAGESSVFYTKEYTWTQPAGERTVQMIAASEGVCFLTKVTGKFHDTGESVYTYIGRDGFWYLAGTSAQAGVSASARCISGVAPSDVGPAPPTPTSWQNVTSDGALGNDGETCIAWLSRIGQLGSARRIVRADGSVIDNNRCVYRHGAGGAGTDWIGFQENSVPGFTQIYPTAGPAGNSYHSGSSLPAGARTQTLR